MYKACKLIFGTKWIIVFTNTFLSLYNEWSDMLTLLNETMFIVHKHFRYRPLGVGFERKSKSKAELEFNYEKQFQSLVYRSQS